LYRSSNKIVRFETDRPAERPSDNSHAVWQGGCTPNDAQGALMNFSLAERDAMRCDRGGRRSARGVQASGQVVGAYRAVPPRRATMKGMPMALEELLPFLGMCTLAAVAYSLACWVGYWL
jgi:hypothetical protein